MPMPSAPRPIAYIERCQAISKAQFGGVKVDQPKFHVYHSARKSAQARKQCL